MKQHEIAWLFTQFADLLELKGDNPFRIRAYRKAAQNLETLTRDLDALDQHNRLTDIPGIGIDLANKIHEYLHAGSIQALEKLKRTVPGGVVALLDIPGVGPKTAKLLYERLHIRSAKQLEAAARAGKLRGLPGFQETKEQNILKGLAIVKRGRERMDLGTAWALARTVIDFLRELPEAKRIEPAGSLRRMKETIGDLDVLVASTKPKKVMHAFTHAPWCARVLASGETKSSILVSDGYQVDLRVVEPVSFGAAWQYFTGSKEHNVQLRELAVRKGFKLNEYGVFNKAGKQVGGREEEEMYQALGLAWMPPELREDTGEIQAASAGRLPKLVEANDLRGDFHIHTNWSDGQHTLEEVAEAGRKRGYEYLTICDHSQSLKVAHGMSPARLGEQLKKISAMNAKLKGFQLLTGAEVDILSDGAMDYTDAVLKRLDFVIGSVHSSLSQPEATMTARIIRAIRNPHVSLIAHPTGRLMGQREPYAVNLQAVFDAAAQAGTAMEINAYPKRLDLNDVFTRQARERGVRLAISTDTHSLDQLDTITIGLGVARRAWLEPRHLLNCLSRHELLDWITRTRACAI